MTHLVHGNLSMGLRDPDLHKRKSERDLNAEKCRGRQKHANDKRSLKSIEERIMEVEQVYKT